MTLCPACATEHRAAVAFAAMVIDVELAGRRKSQAAADLRAMLPPKPLEPSGLDEFHPDTTHNPKEATEVIADWRARGE